MASRTRPIAVCCTLALACGAAGAAGAHLAGKSSTDALPSAPHCAGASSTAPRAAVFAEMKAMGIAFGPADSKRLVGEIRNTGLPAGGTDRLSMMSRSSLEASGALVHRGFVVAARMVHDDSMAQPDYKDAAVSGSLKSYLSILITPTQDGAADPHGPHEGHEAHGDDMTGVNEALLEVHRRIGTVKGGLGKVYEIPAVRYYLLGHAFRDDVAVRAGAKLVCGSALTPGQLKAIGAAADFVRGRKVDAAGLRGGK